MKNTTTSLAQAQNLYKSGMYEKCLQQCDLLLRKQPDYLEVVYLSGIALHKMGEFSAALKRLLPIAKQHPRHGSLINTIGCVYLDSEDWENAERYLLSALEITPGKPDTIFNLGFLYDKQKDFNKALVYYQKSVSLQPNDLTKRLLLCQVLLNLKRVDEAREQLLLAINREENNAQTLELLIRVEVERQNFHGAYLWAKKLVDLYPENSFYWSTMGTVLYELEQYEESLSYYDKGLALDENNHGALCNKACSLEKLKRYDEAKELYKKSIEVAPTFSNSYSNLARIYFLEFKYDKAKEFCEKALELEPDSSAANQNMGTILHKFREYDKALACYFKVIELKPQNPTTYFNIGNLYREREVFDEAIRYYIKAVELDSGYGDAIFNLGVTQLSLGHFEQGWSNYFLRPRFIPECLRKLSKIVPGMDLSGSHIQLLQAQGLGDEIFFLRFLPALKKMDVKISYVSVDKLVPLLRRFPSIDEIITEEKRIESDHLFAVDDLPLILNVTEWSQIPPSLRFEPLAEKLEEVRNKIKKENVDSRKMLGLTWLAGKQTEQLKYSNVRMLQKNIELNSLIELLADYDINILVLQRNVKKEDLQTLKNAFPGRVFDFSSYNEDLELMLALLKQIDEYVGVSNTNMHLLATLDKFAHVLIPHPADWRWLNFGKFSPWFPQFPVYRQDKDGSWKEALKDLKKDLDLVLPSMKVAM
ncbi:MAG: tetratricopeptide repeat protein [Gammaproteobacteria bacterium]|nr:tetratricopeptide repeat protein [Gammaproteobacteria bacterium]MDH5691580.1 tetratricopeptide repeat protein [Gammaproteobacteria bacterium]